MKCRCDRRCFYCDVGLPTRHEHDHFPIPARNGGAEIVPACVTCHDWKDRTDFWDWPEKWVGMDDFAGGIRFWEWLVEINHDPREYSPSAFLLLVEGRNGSREIRWPNLSTAGRIMYARVLASASDEEADMRESADREGEALINL